MSIQIVEWSAQQVVHNRYDIGTVYRNAFATYPYYTPAQVAVNFIDQTLPAHVQRPGFRCIVALNTEYHTLLGFAYGYTGTPGQWWRDNVAKALAPELTAHWMQGYFEVVELAVSPTVQGQGIGGRIHDILLGGISHPRALLSTHAALTPARHMYDRRGWMVLRDSFFFPGTSEPFVIMGLELGQQQVAT